MEANIKNRLKIFKYYKKLLNSSDDKKFLFVKYDLLGEGYQGKVYRYCRKNDKCLYDGIACKKMYLDWKEGKYVEDRYNPKALKYSSFIEAASNELVTQLVVQQICPHFILNYTNVFEERTGICSETYTHKSYYYNEFITVSESYTDWVTKEHSIHLWYNAFFQITISIYALQKYFNMSHVDLHSDNILVKKVKKGGYWSYTINGKIYKVPNLGYIFYICDFGQAWIPNNFKSWFIAQKYKKKHIHKGVDIKQLFKSTISFTTSPMQFKKDVRYIIRKLTKNDNFEDIIEDIWFNRYGSTTNTKKAIDYYDLDKPLKTTNIPKPLRHLVIN